jgi:replicative DNA helicase
VSAAATLYTQHPAELALVLAEREPPRANLGRWLRFAGYRPGEHLEIQALKVRFGPSSERSYYAHASSIANAGALLNKASREFDCGGFYLIGNIVDSAVPTRSHVDEWHAAGKNDSTSDSEIAARVHAFIDIDAVRPKGTSGTDAQVALTATVAMRIHDRLTAILEDSDAIGYGHSGNGRSVFLALDRLDVTASAPLVRGLVAALHALESAPGVEIDCSVTDAKRLVPAWGSLKRKGARGIAERPHRRTAFTCARAVRRLSLRDLEMVVETLREDLDREGRTSVDKAMGVKPSATAPKPSYPTSTGDSPWATANALDPQSVAGWLGALTDDRPTCPGCGESDGGVVILDHGFKCSHRRCVDKGRGGFRTNVDLTAEVRGVRPAEAVNLLAERFGFAGLVARQNEAREPWEAGPPLDVDDEPSIPAGGDSPHVPPALSEALAPSILRVRRRCSGIEKPIALPWSTLNERHFGGGLWPGLHMLNAATGLGKTQFGMQAGAHAATAGIPVLYIGLELGELDLALRILGNVAGVKWSHLWTGKASSLDVDSAEKAIEAVAPWPFRFEIARPHGFPASAIQTAIAGMRATYPEADGPGSRPILVIVDFLQLVGDEPDDEVDLRIRIARASYALRACVNDYSAAVLCVSSIARERVALLTKIHEVAELAWDEDSQQCPCPVNRRILNPDAIVGAGKESGEIEYAADSVSVMARAVATHDGSGCDVVFATAKGRATGANWSPMHFSGFEYTEADDGGARMIASWAEKDQKREKAKEERKNLKEQARLEVVAADSASVVAYLDAHPGCGVTDARFHAVKDSAKRWSNALSSLGERVVQVQGKGKTGSKVELWHRPTFEVLVTTIGEAFARAVQRTGGPS